MSRISILSAAYECPECGVACEPGVTYDPSMYERVTAWRCPECATLRYRADEDDGTVGFLGTAVRVARRLRTRRND